MSATLPPSISQRQLSEAMEEFAKAVGADSVVSSEAGLREFRDPFWPAGDDTYSASAVVMPRSVDEVQAVVRIANQRGIPLWTHSTGRNNGYGGPAPRLGGSVIVSLRNMNRVLEINEELAYAVVEPGVRWFDLYDALQAGGHDLVLSVPDLGWGSVVGNSLENGVSYLPVGKDFMAPCGLEVVLANGELLRTGLGAMPGNPSWHLYRRGLGPTLDPLFMQSNYGIVTRMGVWLVRRPETYVALMLRLWHVDDVGPAIDIIRELRLNDTIQGVPTLGNGLGIASQLTSRSQWYDGDDPLPDEVHEHIARELGVGRWAMRFGLWGDPDVTELRLARIREAFSRIPGAEVLATRYSRDELATGNVAPPDKVLAGIPNLDLNTMTGWYGGEEGGHIGFSPVVPLTGRHFMQVHELLRRVVEQEAGLDFIAGSTIINDRCFIMVAMILFDTKDSSQVERAYAVAKRLVHEARCRGYGEYRAHLEFMDLAAQQYDWGDHAYRRFCERIKDAVDPNGILSPGRQGIWPKRMRPAPAPEA